MRNSAWLVVALFITALAGCEKTETRSDYKDRSADKKMFATDPEGMILSDPMKRDINGWYRQSYTLWQADHNRFYREIKEQNVTGVRNWHKNVDKDLRSMRDAIADQKAAAHLDELIAKYAKIKKFGEARHGIGGALYMLEQLQREIRDDYNPGAVTLKKLENLDEPEKPKEDTPTDEQAPTVKPKW